MEMQMCKCECKCERRVKSANVNANAKVRSKFGIYNRNAYAQVQPEVGIQHLAKAMDSSQDPFFKITSP